MTKRQLSIVKGYKNFDNLIITDTESILDKRFRNCPDKFHKYIFECIYDIKLLNVTNNEIIILTISAKSIDLFELNEKLKLARQNGFIFDKKNNKKFLYTFALYKRKLFSKVSNTDVS